MTISYRTNPARNDTSVEFNPFAGPPVLGALPSTESQREIWTATQITVDASLAFNESVSLTLRGPLQIDALRSAIQALVERHEALRSSFTADGTTMVVHQAPVTDLVLHDLTELPPAQQREHHGVVLDRAVTQPFDLTTPWLVRFELIVLAPDHHVLVITAHHIVCDGWSFGVIASNLAALYFAAQRGEDGTPAPPDRFVDYVASLDAEGSRELEFAERYWLKQFSSEPPILDLPSDRPRPPIKTYSAAREDLTLSLPLIRRLKESAAARNASLFATMLAGFGVLLRHLSGQDDLVIGVPVAGQAATCRLNLVGHCVNMLPIRVRPTAGVRFSDLLGQVRANMLDAVDNQQMTLGSLLRRLPLARDPSRLPLVSAILNLDRRVEPASLRFAGLEAEMVANPRRYETFDLFINAVESDRGVTLECQYNTDLYDRSTVVRWLASYERVLSAVAENIESDIDLIPILSAADKEAIALCNSGATVEPEAETIHGLFELQVAKGPEAVAIEHNDQRVTYAELDARSNQIARHLRTLGVEANVLVGLCVGRSIDMVAGLLAILKAGGGYVPLDPDYPSARLAFMAEDSRMRVLLTTESTRTAVDTLEIAHVVSIDRDAEILAQYSGDRLQVDQSSDVGNSTAYVIYTSGSTGKPKGVVVPHRSVVNLLASVARTPGVTSQDTILAITTLSFDIAVSELILPLVVGARIVLASREVATDGHRLARLIDEGGVTLIDATPATYRLLMAAGWTGSQRLRLICTGEAMPQDLAASLLPRAQQVWNAYGPTETTVWATMYRIENGVAPILIGRPIANTTARVLDQNLLEVPVGIRGELFVGGSAVATGYLDRPDLTAERFIPDPFARDATARMYRTGDIVRLLADGNIECLGRTDHQVKVRGFRIELGEIEAALLRSPVITEAAVTVIEDKGGEPRLAAYLVAPSAETMSDEQLRELLRQSLPEHMIPHVFVRVDHMPLTPSGKIDRKALSKIEITRPAQAEFVEARTDTEHTLAELWKEALGLGRVSIKDDFFALGGHSLLASQLLSRLRTEHGIEVSFRKIFELPTIERLAAFIDASGAADLGVKTSPIRHREGASTAPISVLQERLWLLQELDPQQALVQMHSGAWRLRGRLDPDLLEQSLQQFAMRHEIMRTAFHVQDGVRVQCVGTAVEIELSRLDLSELEESERQAALGDYYRSQQATPFDLAVAPLFRATLIQCGADDAILYTIRSGMIWDGWSFDIFLKELGAIYSAGTVNVAASLPPLPITYGDYASWQRDWARGAEAANHSAWWSKQLEGDLHALELPTDRPRGVQPLYGGSHVMLRFSGAELEALKNVARKYDTTLFMLALAAYEVLLHRYTGETDLLVGSPARGRMWLETENIVGPFVNTLVFRARLDPAMPFADFLRHVREVGLETLSHQEMPFELLTKAPPALRAFFSMQDARARPTSLGEARIEQVHVPQTSASNDLMLWMMEGSDNLVAVLNYSTELFDAATAKRLLGQLRTLLLGLQAESTTQIKSLNIIPPEELSVLLDSERGNRESEVPSLFDRFRAQVEATPDAIALITGGESLTYRQLGDRAIETADYLASLSLSDGARIAVCLGQGCIIPLLAALQCRCSVVLIDVNYPVVYLDKLLADVGAIITPDPAGELPALSGIPIISPASNGAGWRLSASLGSIARGGASEGSLMMHVPGPSGVPCLTSHRFSREAVVLSDLSSALEMTSTDVVVGTERAALDVGIAGLLLPLVCGAKLVIASEDVVSSGDRLGSFLTQVGATLMIAPLERWRALAEADWNGGASFCAVVTGPPRTAAELSALYGRAGRVFTLYGYPETGWVAVHEVVASSPAAIIGRRMGDTRLFVLDEMLSPAPIGVPGQLYIASPYVTEAFSAIGKSPRIISAAATGPVFKTGDAGRRLADGTFVYLSGDKTRSYINGSLVEFSAIEEALRSHPAVSAAAVAGAKDSTGTTRLVAYVERRDESSFTDSELRSRVRRALPDALTPQVFVELEPRPPRENGELDRTALPSPFASEEQEPSFIPPRTDSERLLASVWEETLGIDRVDIRDNFFMLGGSSLMCFRVVEALERVHGIALGPRALLLGSLEQAAAQMEQPHQRLQPLGPAPTTAPPDGGALKKLRGLIEWKR